LDKKWKGNRETFGLRPAKKKGAARGEGGGEWEIVSGGVRIWGEGSRKEGERIHSRHCFATCEKKFRSKKGIISNGGERARPVGEKKKCLKEHGWCGHGTRFKTQDINKNKGSALREAAQTQN